MFKIPKRQVDGEETTDVIKTLSCSTSAKMTLRRNPVRPVHFRAASNAALDSEAQDKKKPTTEVVDGTAGSERVFAISSPGTLTPSKNVITFLASVCCLVALAQAQYSSSSNQYSKPSEVRMAYGGQSGGGSGQASLQSMVTPSSLQARSDGRYVSIDRFDSGGDQIRPPLLGQPTTLAPASKSQQVSAFQRGNYNLEASASDSYMSPEEREQLLRQQESHYEGRGGDATGSNDKTSGYRQQASKSSPEPSSGVDSDGDQVQPVLENRSLQPDAATNQGLAAPNDSDDPDYDQDEEPEQKQGGQKKGTRTGSGPGPKKQAARPETSRRTMHANDKGDESEPNDDFGGVNDDAYFNRQPGAGSGSGSGSLKHAASHHHQGQRGSAGDRSSAGDYNSDNGPASGEGKRGASSAADEGQGFGPGPNEAYLADQAESSGASGKPGLDSSNVDDDSDAGSNVNDMDEGKLDRRSSADSKPNQPGRAAQQESSFDNDDESDADEAADSSEDSFAPASPAGAAEASGSLPQPGNQQSTVPRASASALAPALATLAASSTDQSRNTGAAINPPFKSTLPLFGLHRQQPAPTATTQQYLQQQQQQQVAPNTGSPQQQQLLFGAAAAAAAAGSTGPRHYHKSAFNAAYNPQNNPSHIGKFFIN